MMQGKSLSFAADVYAWNKTVLHELIACAFDALLHPFIQNPINEDTHSDDNAFCKMRINGVFLLNQATDQKSSYEEQPLQSITMDLETLD